MKKGSLVFHNLELCEVLEKKGNTVMLYKPESDFPRATIKAVSVEEVKELKTGDKVNKVDSEGNQLYYYGLSCMKFGNAYLLKLGTINDNRKTAGNYRRETISA